jgi:hypothetical protein
MPGWENISKGKLQAVIRASPSDALWAPAVKDVSIELPKHFVVHIMPSCDLDIEREDLVFALLSLGLALVPSLLSMPLFLPFRIWMLTLLHFMRRINI